MKGVCQHCSKRHLHRYLSEFDFQYSARTALGIDDQERTERILPWHSQKEIDLPALVTSHQRVKDATMTSPINFSISGHNAETDAPTVDDLVNQVGDYVSIMRAVEEALADDGASEIEWRVTNAKKNSPLELEITPFPRRHGVNIEQRVHKVKEHTAAGLALLTAKAERPSFFNDSVLEKVERLFRRVTNGLSLTKVEYGPDIQRTVEITPSIARTAVSHISTVRVPKERPYRELGSVEGFLKGIDRDGFGRAIIYVKLRLNGEIVKCLVSEIAESEVERHQIGDVWKNLRVRVAGTIYYKSLGRISKIDADVVQFLRHRDELPSSSDIINKNFTGGLASTEYLEKLRNGELS